MTKYLLAGAAAAALTLGAGFAAAQDFKVTLSGEAKFQASFAGQKKDRATRASDFQSRFRLDVNPEAKGLDGALTYGAWVKIKNEKSNGTTTFENAYTYLSGAFGRVVLGQIAPFNDDNGNVTKPQDAFSENDIALGFAGKSNDTLYTNGTLETWRNQTIEIMGQSTKVRYDTPFISGVKLGVSYTPNAASSNWDYNRNSTTGVQDAYEIGILFDSTDKSIADKFGAALFKASFGYQGASDANSANEDWNAYQAGVQVGYAGFAIGGHYVYKGKSGLTKTDTYKGSDYSWGFGAQYKFTPALVTSVGYTYSQKDDLATTLVTHSRGLKKADAFTVGVAYTVAKGLTVGADYGYVTTKNTRTNDKDTANVFTLSTTLGF